MICSILTPEELEFKGRFYELIGDLNTCADTRIMDGRGKIIGEKPSHSLEQIKSHDSYSRLTDMVTSNPAIMIDLINFYCNILCKEGENNICADYPFVVQAIYDLKDYL